MELVGQRVLCLKRTMASEFEAFKALCNSSEEVRYFQFISSGKFAMQK